MAEASGASQVGRPDADLVTEALTGSTNAFEELFRRHGHPAWRVALVSAGNARDAAAAVTDGFIDVLQRATRDGYPPRSFRVAVARSTRHAALHPSAKPVELALSGNDNHDESDNALLPVFRTLPERWRTALWLTLVEGGTPDQASALLGLAPDSTTALATRAEAGLRERFLASERKDADSYACETAIDRMGRGADDKHIEECDVCGTRAKLLADLKASLRPLVFAMPAGLEPVVMGRFAQWHEELANANRRRVPWIGPVAPWADKAIAGAAAAVIALGIGGATLFLSLDDNKSRLVRPNGGANVSDEQAAASSSGADGGAFKYSFAGATTGPALTPASGSAATAASSGLLAGVSSSKKAAAAPPAPAPAPPAPAPAPPEPPSSEPPPATEPPSSDAVSLSMTLLDEPVTVGAGPDGGGASAGDVEAGEAPPPPKEEEGISVTAPIIGTVTVPTTLP